MIKNKYEIASKPERDRILGTSFIPSYGPFPVHNVKFNKLVQYLERMNNNLQVSNPSDYQKAIQDTIKMQLNLSRLKILNDYALKEKEAGFGSDLLTSLSFRSWCGLGSPIYDNIKNDLDDPNRMFAIDRICRDHDIAYTKSKTQEEMNEADNIMMKEIFNEYVVNFNKNFLTGDYKSDFTTWTSSFKTVSNYIMTLIETGYVGYVLKNTGKTAYNILKAPYEYMTTTNPLPELTDYLLPAGTYTQRPPSTVSERMKKMITRQIHDPTFFTNKIQKLRASNVLKGIKSNALSLGITFVATNIIKDRLLALGSLAMIGLKKGVESLTNYRFADLTKHDVSDEDLENMKQVFQQLQNQYLQESNLNPIKIGDEWLNDVIEIPPIETLKSEIDTIVEQNKTYNETKTEIIDAIVDSIDELILQSEPEPTEPIPTEQSDNLKKLQDLYKLTVKLFEKIDYDYETVEPPTQLVPNLEEDIKKSKDTTLIQDEVATVPNIPEDIKTSQKTTTLIQKEIEPQEKEEIKINYKNEL
jgi:hypothetical protein